MRKQAKKQLCESMEYLIHTADTIGGLLGRLSPEQAMDVLAQMQELVIHAGETIEASEKNCTEIIQKLENTCEIIYQLTNLLEDFEVRKHLLKELKEIFVAAYDEIQKKIPGKLEILFLPYQVSMWDSLESVWMAARDSGDSDCYVVPIPFYDVLPDNTLGSIHYEGDLYPDYVPITSYLKYSIQTRKPDIIFFHNPYDEFNRVTRIPEQYYSKNLKQYTDMLVYIPYFVSEEGGPAEHQCYTSGVLFADRVIVQPGSIYEKYCRVYTDILKRNGLEEKLVPAEKKFLPLGSPKFDKILNTKCQIKDLPKKWQKVILKSNGSRKKIILYNLSIISLLENREQTLKKLDNILCLFKQNQEEIVLLWRPHPLLVNTINSMIPWLRDAYLQRVEAFKEKGWGIYDETPDPNLAMALSDGYYGDPSSLVTTYRETGKPILLQNVYILDECNEIYFRAAANNKVEENGKIWIALLNRNGICEINKETRCARILKIFEEESLTNDNLYSHIEKFENNLVFTPGMAEKIAIYNLEYDSLFYISLSPLEHLYKESMDGIKFWNTFQYQSDIYMFGYSYPAIIKIDMNSMELTYITDWVDEVEKDIQYGNMDGYFSDGHVLCGDLVLVPVGCMNAVLELNLKNGHTKIKHLKVSMKGIGGLSSLDGNIMWIVGRSNITNRISCWNRQTDTINEFLLTDIDENMYAPFYAPICIESKILLVPLTASCIYEINIYTGKIKKNKVSETLLKNPEYQLWPWWKTMAVDLQGEWLTFSTCNDFKWHEYNVITGEFQSYIYYIQEDLMNAREHFDSLYKEKNILISESKLPLKYFKEKILCIDAEKNYEDDLCFIGESVYNQISK